jgi:hypothetical protein
MPNPLEKRKSLLDRASQFNDNISSNLGFDGLNKLKNDSLEAMDAGIQKHIVNPITEAGYPNAGAGIGTAISAPVRTVASLVPESAASAAATFFPAGKVTKLFNPAEESFLIKSIKAAHPEATDDVVKTSLLNLEKQQAARNTGKDLADAKMVQRDTIAANQLDALTTKPAPVSIISGKDIPIPEAFVQTARTTNTVGDDMLRRSALSRAAGK